MVRGTVRDRQAPAGQASRAAERRRRIEHRAPLRHARQGGAHQARRRLLLVAPAHDDRPVADQEDEGLGRLLRRELQRAADQAAVLAAAGGRERGAEPGDVGQCRVDLRQDLRCAAPDRDRRPGAPRRSSRRTSRSPCRPRAAADRPAGRRRRRPAGGGSTPRSCAAAVVQRLAAYAQRAHAGAGRDDQRALAGHFAARLAGRLWRVAMVPVRCRRQTRLAQSRSTNFCTLPVEVIGSSRNTT